MSSEIATRKIAEAEAFPQPAGHLAVLPSMAFLADIRTEAAKSTKRTWGQTMVMKYAPIVNELGFAFLPNSEEDRRDIRLHIDYQSLRFLQLGRLDQEHKIPITWPQEGDTVDRGRHAAMFNKIEREGGKVVFISKPRRVLDHLMSPAGRSHSKCAVVDDIAYVGGINYMDGNFEAVDCMVKVTTPELVEDIADQFMRVNENARTKDHAYPWRNDTRILVDAGNNRTSIILDCAIDLINSATSSIQILSPVKPDGKFLDALRKAYKRGVGVEVVVPTSPGFAPGFWIANRLSEIEQMAKGSVPIFQYEDNLHAKTLLVDKKRGMIGSHNFTWKGVWMRTAEMAIESQDPVFAQNLEAFYNTTKARSYPISHHLKYLNQQPIPNRFDNE